MYTLQAIILKSTEPPNVSEFGLRLVEINCNLFMVPLTYDYVESKGIPFLPLTDGGIDRIEESLRELCIKISSNCKAAYVEAEFFGGEGTQACALFERGIEIEPTLIDDWAINHALKWLGVLAENDKDEFIVAGLGMKRNTEEWLNA